MLSAVAARNAKRSQSHHAKARKRSKKVSSPKDVDRSDDYSSMSIDVTPSQPEQRRAYSPSRLAIDSDGASDANRTRSQFPSYSNHPTNEDHNILSTYLPSPDRNMFHLSLDEGSSLGLSGPAVALVLFPSATVALVGTYRLRVLHGSVSLLGAIVRPSQVVHQVFAPSSSPIPVVQALAAGGESSKSLSGIPARILSTITDGNAVIVLQDLQTGVEGLGRVVRTFDGVFHDAQSKGVPVGPLQGVHFVSHSFLETAFFFLQDNQTSKAARGLRAFQLLPSWEAALSESPFSSANETVETSKLPVVLVKGQKNSGKSTFARTIVNRLSSQCAPNK